MIIEKLVFLTPFRRSQRLQKMLRLRLLAPLWARQEYDVRRPTLCRHSGCLYLRPLIIHSKGLIPPCRD